MSNLIAATEREIDLRKQVAELEAELAEAKDQLQVATDMACTMTDATQDLEKKLGCLVDALNECGELAVTGIAGPVFRFTAGSSSAVGIVLDALPDNERHGLQ